MLHIVSRVPKADIGLPRDRTTQNLLHRLVCALFDWEEKVMQGYVRLVPNDFACELCPPLLQQ